MVDDVIDSWWEGRTDERFWLGVTRMEAEREVLAAPCDSVRGAGTAKRPLIRHIAEGDTVFHFDEERQAIVAWSTPRGRARKCRMAWSRSGRHWDPQRAWLESLHSWTIALEQRVPLAEVVPLSSIARIQYELFPALRTLEDTVGASLHYPFSLGSPLNTYLLAGHVFKLPALFVAACPSLAAAVRPAQAVAAMA